MCGIFGVISASPKPAADSIRQCFDALSLILGCDPDCEESSIGRLARALEASAALVSRSGFLTLTGDPALLRQLDSYRDALSRWLAGLESKAETRRVNNQRVNEVLNRLIIGGRDLLWRIERDVQNNIACVGRLAGNGQDAGASTLGHLWQLNLMLNNLDRLEVRGRDSAGIAAYIRFATVKDLDRFLASWESEFDERARLRCFIDRAAMRPQTSDNTLLFAFKVASVVGEMGANVRKIREGISGDRLFQAALRQPGVQMDALAHTRWASNGVISLPNCHPVDSAHYKAGSAAPVAGGTLVAVLNGDIDNYQELMGRHVLDRGFEIESDITTDAKIIPVMVAQHYRRCGSLEEAFRCAFDEFEGSMAIGVMAADHPGELLFAQKGSGQGLFFGFAGESVTIASEMYGLVELTGDYVKAEGERVSGGEVFRVKTGKDRVEVHLLANGSEIAMPADRLRRAEVTTRDINRGEFPRFLLKEISESVESVRKTLRGRFEIDDLGKPHFGLGSEVLDPERLERLRSGSVRRILAIGQGTAAIAAQGVAYLLSRTLSSVDRLEIGAAKATEVSAHALRDDMSDTLVIAVSQSGTTTDTNRTVDMLRERGAWIISIVNRRNSDLVYKSHGVLYTSDGRDIEMSVASTKAFYSQNVAGAILAMALAEALGALPPDTLAREAAALAALPAAMKATLELGPSVRELADRHALRFPYWAVVGSGPNKIAADEIRIKLSELCYKSIASDFLEDKKHIDLSSEPLVLVCANGISSAMISDAVKEVAIFKAHRSLPLVIADAGEHRFDPYAAGVIRVPPNEGPFGYILATMVGHLFAYHAAASFDRHASSLRSICDGTLRVLDAARRNGEERLHQLQLLPLPSALVSEIVSFQELLQDGSLDSGLRTGTAVRLSAVLQFLLGRITFDQLSRQLRITDQRLDLLDLVVSTLTASVNDLVRPIDAIKHQAKTVTVGISRLEAPGAAGLLWSELTSLGVPLDDLAESHRVFLKGFEPIVAAVHGATLYSVSGLDAVGRPTEGSRICVQQKTGAAAEIASRCDAERPLEGTKWGVVKSRQVYLGYGQNDGRRILIVPLVGEKAHGHLILFHLSLAEVSDRNSRIRALSVHPTLLERLKIAVTERNRAWTPELIDLVDNETLFLQSAEHVADVICRRNATIAAQQ